MEDTELMKDVEQLRHIEKQYNKASSFAEIESIDQEFMKVHERLFDLYDESSLRQAIITSGKKPIDRYLTMRMLYRLQQKLNEPIEQAIDSKMMEFSEERQ